MSDSVLFDAFLSKHPQVRFIHLQWLDYTSTLRGRVFPVRNVREMLATEQTHRLGGLNMCRIDNVAPPTQNDASGSVGGPVGQGRLVPDLVSIRLCPGLEGHASIFATSLACRSMSTKRTRSLIPPRCVRSVLGRLCKGWLPGQRR